MARRLPPLHALAVAALVIGGCGGSSSPDTNALPKLDVPLSKSMAITSGDVDIFAAGNATANLLSSPGAAEKGRRLLRPLIVAKTLRVGSGNPVAGGLVQSISSQLDNTVPGLTKQSGALDGALVRSFLRYGEKEPKRVFEPEALAGANRLYKLMHGLRATAIVNDSQPPQTARELVARDLETAGTYWPAVAKRLELLRSSLR